MSTSKAIHASAAQLPLTPAESSLLSQHQRVALQHQHQDSSGGNILLIDPDSLSTLSAHLDALLASLASRLEGLAVQVRQRAGVDMQHARTAHACAAADAEIARFEALLDQIDALEAEFEKIARIGDIVKGFRARLERLERRFA